MRRQRAFLSCPSGPAAVVVVGVADHAAQFGTGVDALAFGRELLRLCKLHGVAAIAEEASNDALASHGVPSTMGARVAASLSIRPLMCDPGEEERKRLGLDWQHADLHLRLAWEGRLHDYQRELQRQFRVREQIWLKRLQELGVYPLLFVCGAEHSDPFAALLREHGFVVI